MDDYSGSAPEVANRILKSTVTVSDLQTDFQPSLRRVKYDLDEVNGQIKECVSSSTPQLIQTVQSIKECKEIASSLEPDLENVITEYERLDREFISPYERLKRAHVAAQRLHQTSELVRACNWYLQIAKELEQTLKVSSGALPTQKVENNIYASALLVSKLDNLLQSNLHLQSLAIIRQHERTLLPTRQKLVAMALDTIKEYNGGKTALKNAVLTLCMFDTNKLFTTVDTWLRAQASSTVLSITRSVASQAAFDSTWSQATEKAKNISQMSDVLGECFMLTRAENKVGGALTPTFWNLVSTNMSQKLHTMSVANPTQMKAMKTQGKHILETVESVKEISSVFKKYIS